MKRSINHDWLSCLLSFLLVVSLKAFPQPSAVSSPELTITVKPKLCLRYSSADICDVEVEVSWNDTVEADYCLFSDQAPEDHIRCWQGVNQAQLSELRSLEADLTYWLSLPGQTNKLVEAKVELATIVSSERRRSSRRRHVWNLI